MIHVRLLKMKCIFSSYKLWMIFFNILVLYWWLNNLFIYLCLFFLPALWICTTKLFSLTFFYFVFVYVICVFLYTIVNWIMRIKIYSICQHFFLPVYVYFSKCWHILNEHFQHVILRIFKTMIPKLIIKIKYSKYKIDLLIKCQK